MPQEIRVVQCFQCLMFQVDIVKKSNKWQCKVCNTKQSLRREYFRGSGAECRDQVQELNRLKGERAAQESTILYNLLNEHQNIKENSEIESFKQEKAAISERKANKWESFLDEKSIQKRHQTEFNQNSKRTYKDDDCDIPPKAQKQSKWGEFL